MLTALRSTSDGVMDDVHTMRDNTGADFVSLWSPLTGSCGRGYRMTNLSTSFASNAFNVCDPDCQFQFTFTHELGHNFGCHHAIGDNGLARGGSVLFPYSYGYRFTGTNSTTYRSVMAYSPGTRVRQWSDPDVLYQGVAPDRADLEDNARSIGNAASTLEQFRGNVVDDHGNTISTATQVTSNSSTGGNLETGTDVDVFRFQITTPSTVVIETSGSTDTAGLLTTATGSTIASDNDSGSGSNIRIGRILSAGDYYYYIHVDGESGSTGAYALMVSTDDADDP